MAALGGHAGVHDVKEPASKPSAKAAQLAVHSPPFQRSRTPPRRVRAPVTFSRAHTTLAMPMVEHDVTTGDVISSPSRPTSAGVVGVRREPCVSSSSQTARLSHTPPPRPAPLRRLKPSLSQASRERSSPTTQRPSRTRPKKTKRVKGKSSTPARVGRAAAAAAAATCTPASPGLDGAGQPTRRRRAAAEALLFSRGCTPAQSARPVPLSARSARGVVRYAGRALGTTALPCPEGLVESLSGRRPRGDGALHTRDRPRRWRAEGRGLPPRKGEGVVVSARFPGRAVAHDGPVPAAAGPGPSGRAGLRRESARELSSGPARKGSTATATATATAAAHADAAVTAATAAGAVVSVTTGTLAGAAVRPASGAARSPPKAAPHSPERLPLTSGTSPAGPSRGSASPTGYSLSTSVPVIMGVPPRPRTPTPLGRVAAPSPRPGFQPPCLTVHGIVHSFPLRTAQWQTQPISLVLPDALTPVGTDDLFLYYAGTVMGSNKLEEDGEAIPAGAPCTVKVFRPEVVAVTTEEDYFAQLECQAVVQLVAQRWETRMLVSTAPMNPAAAVVAGNPAYVGPHLASPLPYLQTYRRLVRLDAASVQESLAKCVHEADPTGDGSLFARTTDDTGELLCILERGTYFPPVTASSSLRRTPPATPAEPAAAVSSGLIRKSRPAPLAPPGTAPVPATTRTNSTATGTATVCPSAHLFAAKLTAALAHLSFEESGGSVLLTGLREGNCCRDEGSSALDAAWPTVRLTDPMVHATVCVPRRTGLSRTPFGRTNGGSSAFPLWIDAHTCNELCGLLSLRSPASLSPTPGSGAVVRGAQDPSALRPVPAHAFAKQTDADEFIAVVRAMRERLPVRVPVSLPGSALSSPLRGAASRTRARFPGKPPGELGVRGLDVAGGVLYVFDAGGSARWQPSKVTVRLLLAEAGDPDAGDDRFCTFNVQVRTEEVRGEYDDGPGARCRPCGFQRMTARAFAPELPYAKRDDEAYFRVAGERSLLAEVVAEYNLCMCGPPCGSKSAAAAADVVQPLRVAPCGVIRLNRNKVRATLDANGGYDDPSKRSIIDFFSTDSRDILLLVDAVDADGVALLESNYTETPQTIPVPQPQASTAGRSSRTGGPLSSAVKETATREAFTAFCRGCVADLLTIQRFTLSSAAFAGVASGGRNAQGRGSLPLTGQSPACPGYLVTSVIITTADESPPLSTLTQRLRVLLARIREFHVYTALKYAFDFQKLKWQPVETFICIPTPDRGIGAGTFRVCFEVLELPRRRRAASSPRVGCSAEGESVQGSACGHVGLSSGGGVGSVTPSPVCASLIATPGTTSAIPGAARVHSAARTLSGVSACVLATAAGHASARASPLESPPLPRLETRATAAPEPAMATTPPLPVVDGVWGGGPLPSQTGVWTANVAKMFKRNTVAGAGLPITEHNYFFEAMKQNYSACVARDFNNALARAPARTSRSATPAATDLPLDTPSLRQWQLSSGSAPPRYPQLLFIPASVVTLRFDIDLPLHLCRARKGFFSYRCTETKKRNLDAFEEDLGRRSNTNSGSHFSTLLPSTAAVRKTAEEGRSAVRPQCMTFTLEPRLNGHFSKYTCNDGRVFYTNETPLPPAEREVRRQIVKCAEALSHFSLERSNGGALVCDLQGVQTALTDPEIHTYDNADYDDQDGDSETGVEALGQMLDRGGIVGKREDSRVLFEQTTIFLAGNGGRDGIGRFELQHRCNKVCAAVGLAPLRQPRRAGEDGGLSGVKQQQNLEVERFRNRYVLLLKGMKLAAQML